MVTALMSRNLYLPLLISASPLVLCIVLLCVLRIPTREHFAAQDGLDPCHEPLLNSENSPPYAGGTLYCVPHEEIGETGQQENHTAESFTSNRYGHLENAAGWLRREPVLAFSYLSFFLKSNAMASESFLFQYLSEVFGWPLQDTTVLRFALSSGAVLMTMFIGPAASYALARRGMPTSTIVMGTIYLSTIALTIFFLVAWRAPSSKVFILCRPSPVRFNPTRPLLMLTSCSHAWGGLLRGARTCAAGAGVCVYKQGKYGPLFRAHLHEQLAWRHDWRARHVYADVHWEEGNRHLGWVLLFGISGEMFDYAAVAPLLIMLLLR